MAALKRRVLRPPWVPMANNAKIGPIDTDSGRLQDRFRQDHFKTKAMQTAVTTSRAAAIIGIGYEGLRSYLKRGLLGKSGLMPPLVSKDSPAPDQSAVRASWKRFGFTDLCLMRLAKQLVDMGLSFDQANSIVSNEEMRALFREGSATTDAVVMCWPPFQEYMVFVGEERRYLADHLAQANGTALVIELKAIAQTVTSKLKETRNEGVSAL
ncbi:hypothetical protein AB8E26_01410 [Stenotrophomonas rhizophila]|uniref:hypothetical protein n=1 Tax=Stenotrophomonas rhizophila TaxID=216778 RepID=UPI003513B59C